MRITQSTPLSILLLASFLTASMPLMPIADSRAQSLEELKELPAYRKLTADAPKTKSNPAQPGQVDFTHTNFGSLWTSARSSALLLSWLQAKLPGYKYLETSVGLHQEYAGAQAFLYNKQLVRVQVDVLIPRAEYTTMAQFNTLKSFNQYRPPALDVIAEQVIPIQGMDANYYRTRKGECSLLFKVERLGIVNIAVDKCADSKVMMDIAKQLNFARLNQKLLS